MLLNKNPFFQELSPKYTNHQVQLSHPHDHSPSTKKNAFVLAVPLSPLKSKHNEKNPVQNAVKKKLKHFVTFRSSKLAEQLLPVTKALANGSVKKAVTLLLNTSDTKIKENATKAIQYVIDRECYSFSDRDMNIQLQKTATSELENFDLQKIRRDFETHAPLLWACASQAETSTHRKTFNSVKVCAALCVLVQGRSRILNSLSSHSHV